MPVRFFIPLPGPFYFQRKSRAERYFTDLERRQRQADQDARWDALSDDQRSARSFLAVLGMFAAIGVALWYFAGMWWGLGFYALIVLFLINAARAKHAEGKRIWQS